MGDQAKLVQLEPEARLEILRDNNVILLYSLHTLSILGVNHLIFFFFLSGAWQVETGNTVHIVVNTTFTNLKMIQKFIE